MVSLMKPKNGHPPNAFRFNLGSQEILRLRPTASAQDDVDE